MVRSLNIPVGIEDRTAGELSSIEGRIKGFLSNVQGYASAAGGGMSSSARSISSDVEKAWAAFGEEMPADMSQSDRFAFMESRYVALEQAIAARREAIQKGLLNRKLANEEAAAQQEFDLNEIKVAADKAAADRRLAVDRSLRMRLVAEGRGQYAAELLEARAAFQSLRREFAGNEGMLTLIRSAESSTRRRIMAQEMADSAGAGYVGGGAIGMGQKAQAVLQAAGAADKFNLSLGQGGKMLNILLFTMGASDPKIAKFAMGLGVAANVMDGFANSAKTAGLAAAAMATLPTIGLLAAAGILTVFIEQMGQTAEKVKQRLEEWRRLRSEVDDLLNKRSTGNPEADELRKKAGELHTGQILMPEPKGADRLTRMGAAMGIPAAEEAKARQEAINALEVQRDREGALADEEALRSKAYDIIQKQEADAAAEKLRKMEAFEHELTDVTLTESQRRMTQAEREWRAKVEASREFLSDRDSAPFATGRRTNDEVMRNLMARSQDGTLSGDDQRIAAELVASRKTTLDKIAEDEQAAAFKVIATRVEAQVTAAKREREASDARIQEQIDALNEAEDIRSEIYDTEVNKELHRADRKFAALQEKWRANEEVLTMITAAYNDTRRKIVEKYNDIDLDRQFSGVSRHVDNEIDKARRDREASDKRITQLVEMYDEMDQIVFEASHSQEEIELRASERKFARLREQYAENEEALTLIKAAEEAKRGEIARKYAGDGRSDWSTRAQEFRFLRMDGGANRDPKWAENIVTTNTLLADQMRRLIDGGAKLVTTDGR